MDIPTYSHTAELLQSARSALAMLEFMSSISPTKYNYWNMNARHLRAAIDRLKASTAATDTESPTRA